MVIVGEFEGRSAAFYTFIFYHNSPNLGLDSSPSLGGHASVSSGPRHDASYE